MICTIPHNDHDGRILKKNHKFRHVNDYKFGACQILMLIRLANSAKIDTGNIEQMIYKDSDWSDVE
jgi:hypothetical protein